MKLGKLRTLRGQITVTGGVGRLNLIASDGLVNLGLKINSFQIWSSRNQGSVFQPYKFTGILSLDTIAAGSDMNAADNRQFAWSFYSSDATGVLVNHRTVIDPDHIVNRDLFLTMDDSSTDTYNYLIEAQVVELTDDEAIITIIKETSQA